MERSASPKKKLKSPVTDATANLNYKTSITCANVPESLFEPGAAEKHFSKFGRALKIRLIPRRQMCIVEYDQPISAEKAVLNAGAYDGFMFDVTRTKPRMRRRSRRDDDPDWLPDPDVEEELSAMSGAPIYRVPRQKSMETDTAPQPVVNRIKTIKRVIKQTPVKTKGTMREKKPIVMQPVSGVEPSVVTSHTSLSTSEAAVELHQLRFKVSLTPDEQWRILDARDRILRAWGGAGSRVKIGGATIGTCPDMCPEKELLHRQAEHQVMTLETIPGSDGELEQWRAVKQYSRSSADQEIPMCYELRPAAVLMRTCAYLLHEIGDTKRQVSLADWFHFMWDRLRGIRKDITQQALCCAESIRLVEMCARFHAHCAARLADLEHTQFDQKLNTDNLTKCLQTLKHMYADVGPDMKPCEAEFRGYIALLNLGDANFWWEIQQLPLEIQKSEPIMFAIKVFNALDNNNYVRFFRLVKENATYLQACILLRYFNDVRARALARIVKAYAPRGGSRYPAEDLMSALAFESVESMKSFVNHYGLRFGKDVNEITVILDRNQFIEDSDPYPIARAINLIESKRFSNVGEVIAGGHLPNYDYKNHTLYKSFTKDGRLKETALIAEDQGYNTVNDSNKDVLALKAEIQRLAQGGKAFLNAQKVESKANLFVKPDTRSLSPGKPLNSFAASGKLNSFASPVKVNGESNLFAFKPAIPVAPTEIIKNSPENMFKNDSKNLFSFSKPQETIKSSNLFGGKDTNSTFKTASGKSLFGMKPAQCNNALLGKSNENRDPFPNTQDIFKKSEEFVFRNPETSIFGQGINIPKQDTNKNVFGNVGNNNLFTKKDIVTSGQIFFGKPNDIFSANKTQEVGSIFAKAAHESEKQEKASSIFAQAAAVHNDAKDTTNIFAAANQSNSLLSNNGDANNILSPGSLFKSAISTDGKSYSIFQSKNKAPSVADNIFNSVKKSESTVYDFNQNEDDIVSLNEQRIKEEMERKAQEKKLQAEEEQRRREEQKREEERRRQEEERRKEEERKKQEEMRRLEEKRKKEQEELKRKLEEERIAELKRKAEEEKRRFLQRVEKESTELIEELIHEVRDETVRAILTEEVDKMNKLMSYADLLTDEIWTELCNEICQSEMQAEKFWTEKLEKKWFYMWRKQLFKNLKQRRLLEDTPVWLPDKTPIQEAACLRRLVEQATLKNMNAVHRGYKFTGELRQLPSPEAFNVMEIIKSPFLKRMKQISYPYDKCFFWKVTLVAPGQMKWLCKKIDVEKWLMDVFSDKQQHETSESLIHVGKQSWNNLMDFVISVSLINNKDKKNISSEAIDGTNGILFYSTENDFNFTETIEETLQHKYPYQVIPVAVILPKMEDYLSKYNAVEQSLASLVEKNVISCFKIFIVDPNNISDSLIVTTKTALRWLSKKYPEIPPLEIDHLKSICQRYLGNEIWYRLKSDRDCRMRDVLKDLCRLVNCYNTAIDKLTSVITNEELFNYSQFPLEFKEYLDHTSPYPKPYEFIPTSAKNSDNTSAIRDIMKKLKLPNPVSEFEPVDVPSMQNQIREYCNQIGWFENPEEVICKVVAVLPNQFSDLDMPREQFSHFFEQYDLIDFLNIIVYEKISRLNNFDNRFAVYERSSINEYQNCDWLYEIEVLSKMKHKFLEYEDDVDTFIDAKRRKIAAESMEYLFLVDSDSTVVEENIKEADKSITKYKDCTEAVKQLEEQIDLERMKSMELENLLRSALSN